MNYLIVVLFCLQTAIHLYTSQQLAESFNFKVNLLTIKIETPIIVEKTKPKTIVKRKLRELNPKLVKAIKEYSGPPILITSTVRLDNPRSMHFVGKAIDINFCPAVIDYLLTEEGKKWLSHHKLNFYIEGRPSSLRIRRYLEINETKDYVFLNPKARGRTGDHLHIWLEE